jgi:hypothetical protein
VIEVRRIAGDSEIARELLVAMDRVAGGGVRRLGQDVAEVKRMYTLPDARVDTAGGCCPPWRTRRGSSAAGYPRLRLCRLLG